MTIAPKRFSSGQLGRLCFYANQLDRSQEKRHDSCLELTPPGQTGRNDRTTIIHLGQDLTLGQVIDSKLLKVMVNLPIILG